jgi:hypothetical protein
VKFLRPDGVSDDWVPPRVDAKVFDDYVGVLEGSIGHSSTPWFKIAWKWKLDAMSVVKIQPKVTN